MVPVVGAVEGRDVFLLLFLEYHPAFRLLDRLLEFKNQFKKEGPMMTVMVLFFCFFLNPRFLPSSRRLRRA